MHDVPKLPLTRLDTCSYEAASRASHSKFTVNYHLYATIVSQIFVEFEQGAYIERWVEYAYVSLSVITLERSKILFKSYPGYTLDYRNSVLITRRSNRNHSFRT